MAIRPPRQPALPIASIQYDKQYVDQLLLTLRLYFGEVDSSIRAILTYFGYQISGFFAGVPSGSATITLHVFPQSLVFPASMAGSEMSLGTAATATTVFDIQKNGVSVATATFAAGGTRATFTGIKFDVVAGDTLSIIAPGVPDATAADIAYTLTGLR